MPLPSLLRPRGRHHVAEAAKPVVAAAPAKIPERAGYVYGIPPGGMDEVRSGIGGSTQSDRKSLLQELYEAYLACPWAWAAVQSIARTITSGGLVTDWTADTGEGDQTAPDKPPPVVALEALIAYCNPQQNIRQLLRNAIADLQVFGDAYIEVAWWGSLPVALYNLDSPTTTPIADVHGAVTAYVQVTDFGQRADFESREVIHISLDSARPGVLGVSPMQAALGPVTSWLFAAGTGKEEFRKGLPPNIHADFPAAAGEKDMRLWRDQYSSKNLGARNIGAPIITKGGVGLKELQTGKIADVIAGKNQCRDEILSTFGVPPAKAGVIESGNLGGGTGESQDKTYRVDTCGPVAELVLEKFNFHITIQAFHITDWTLKFGEVDYRDSVIVENIRDQRLRNGSWTLNKYRAEIGEPPVPGGDDAILVDRQNLVLWAQMGDMSQANINAKNSRGQGGQTPGIPGLVKDSDPSDDPNAGTPPAGKDAPAESLRADQIARYQARLQEALGRMPPIGQQEGK